MKTKEKMMKRGKSGIEIQRKPQRLSAGLQLLLAGEGKTFLLYFSNKVVFFPNSTEHQQQQQLNPQRDRERFC